MVRKLALSFAIALGAASGSCSFDADPVAGSCVEGQQISCNCSGGRIGAHRCRTDSTFGPCVCSAVESSAPGDGQDASLPADPGDTGANAGSPATAGSSASAGTGAAGGAAGSGPAGRAGTGGAGGKAGSSGTGGRGGTGGDPDDAGQGGEGGEGEAGEGEAGAGGPPEPGGPYSSCSDDTDCDDDLVCAIGTQNRPGTGYCTAFCDTMAGGECPQPPSGTVKGMCLSLVNICILTNCMSDTCPDGMECIRAGQDGPFGPGQSICQYEHDSSGPGP